MRNSKKRLEKVYAELPPNMRVLAALEALGRDDDGAMEAICKTTPRKTYASVDARFSDTLNAVSKICCRFDCGFYRNLFQMHEHLGIRLGVARKMTKAEGLEHERMDEIADTATENVRFYMDDTHALVLGLKAFSQRIGLPLERLLACSMAYEADREVFDYYLNPPVEVQGRMEGRIDDIAAAFAELWGHGSRFTITQFKPLH